MRRCEFSSERTEACCANESDEADLRVELGCAGDAERGWDTAVLAFPLPATRVFLPYARILPLFESRTHIGCCFTKARCLGPSERKYFIASATPLASVTSRPSGG